jgi:hypothetical protein
MVATLRDARSFILLWKFFPEFAQEVLHGLLVNGSGLEEFTGNRCGLFGVDFCKGRFGVAIRHENELAEIAEGSGAFVSNAIADEGFEDDLQGGVNIEIGLRSEMQHGGGEIFFDGRFRALEIGVARQSP